MRRTHKLVAVVSHNVQILICGVLLSSHHNHPQVDTYHIIAFEGTPLKLYLLSFAPSVLWPLTKTTISARAVQTSKVSNECIRRIFFDSTTPTS